MSQIIRDKAGGWPKTKGTKLQSELVLIHRYISV